MTSTIVRRQSEVPWINLPPNLEGSVCVELLMARMVSSSRVTSLKASRPLTSLGAGLMAPMTMDKPRAWHVSPDPVN